MNLLKHFTTVVDYLVSVQNRHLASPLNKCYICAHIKNQQIMLSTTDFEKLLLLYKTEEKSMIIVNWYGLNSLKFYQ